MKKKLLSFALSLVCTTALCMAPLAVRADWHAGMGDWDNDTGTPDTFNSEVIHQSTFPALDSTNPDLLPLPTDPSFSHQFAPATHIIDTVDGDGNPVPTKATSHVKMSVAENFYVTLPDVFVITPDPYSFNPLDQAGKLMLGAPLKYKSSIGEFRADNLILFPGETLKIKVQPTNNFALDLVDKDGNSLGSPNTIPYGLITGASSDALVDGATEIYSDTNIPTLINPTNSTDYRVYDKSYATPAVIPPALDDDVLTTPIIDTNGIGGTGAAPSTAQACTFLPEGLNYAQISPSCYAQAGVYWGTMYFDIVTD